MEKRHILFKKIFCPFTSRFGAPRKQSVLPPPDGLLRLADKLCATAEIMGFWKRCKVRPLALAVA